MQKVRLKDVAERAGVAINTASTILNRRSNSWASKETEERVFNAAAALGYKPNRAAQALRFGRYHALALVIADLQNPYYTAFADAMEDVAGDLGYDVLIETWRHDLKRERRILDELGNRQVDGIAAFLSDPEVYRDYLAEQTRRRVPFVVISTTGEEPLPVDSVLADFEQGLRDAVDELVAKGHRRFAFICALAQGQYAGRRPELFRRLLGERGIGEDAFQVVQCDHAIASAHAAATVLLAQVRHPTAIIGLNDLSAIGAMRAAAERGLKLPADVSIVGVDDIPFASFLPVSLSTIAQPIIQMAARSVNQLIERIEGADPKPKPKHLVFPTEFIQRESIGWAKDGI